MTDFYYKAVGTDGDIVTVVLSGKLDALHCDYLLECVEHQIEEGHNKLILDCTDLEYISSVGLGMMLRVHTRMKKQGGDVKLAAVRGVVAAVISVSRLDKVFQIFPTVEEAVAAHGG
jgi:anti-sigma B factor antagonist